MAVEPQPRTDFIPAEEFVIDNLDTLKVISDPLRLRIAELLGEPTTVKQVAAELDMPPTKLYYHIAKLEEHGLIVLVDTRIVSGIIEKHYRIVAKSIRVDRNLLSPGTLGDEGMSQTITNIFEDVRDDFIESIKAGTIDLSEGASKHHSGSFSTSRFRLTEGQAENFFQSFIALVKDYSDLSDDQEDRDDTQNYKLMYMMFPSSRAHRPRKSSKE